MSINKLKQIKYKKFKKGRLKNFEFKINNLKFGTYGLKAVQSGVIKAHQLNAAKQAITKKLKKNGKLWVSIFTNFAVTSKPVGTRMGKGKGIVSHWIAKVSRGSILFETCGFNHNLIFLALKIGSLKLPIKTKIIKN